MWTALTGVIASGVASVVFHLLHLLVMIGGYSEGGPWKTLQAVLLFGALGIIAAMPLPAFLYLRSRKS
jgi:hypothetical protein